MSNQAIYIFSTFYKLSIAQKFQYCTFFCKNTKNQPFSENENQKKVDGKINKIFKSCVSSLTNDILGILYKIYVIVVIYIIPLVMEWLLINVIVYQ